MSFLTKLFEPGKIGTMQLANRIIMAPMSTRYGNEDGTVSDRLIRYYVERAKGGVGLIIVENIAIAPEGKASARELRIYGDEFIPGLARLVAALRPYGPKIAIQPHHTGRQTTAEAAGGRPVAPSPIPCPLRKVVPRELATGEVEELVEAFAEAARRAKEAGFDAIEFHGAHGYLICQFLSTYSNKRTDKYGGDLENRMRFALEIVTRAKEKVGPDYPLLIRLSAQEFVPNGITLEETRILARRLQDAGIHCLDISAGNYETGQMIVQPSWMPRGCLVPLAEEIKKVVNIPVSVAGRISDPILANSILEQGKVDFVSLGRPLLADAYWASKAKEGKAEDILKCIACCHCADITPGEGQSLNCAVNATVGKEEFLPKPAPKPKRVLIVGGGPAGMEAARVAALRGHNVTLYEKEKSLGGQLLMASVPPGKKEIATTTVYLLRQVSKLGVEVKRGQRATVESVSQMNPDVVVIATGSLTPLPDISGSNLPHVAMAREVLIGRKAVGQKVIVVGVNRVGCETAELLARRGKDVTLSKLPGEGRMALDVGILSRKNFLRKLRESPVKINDGYLEKITQEGVVIRDNGQSASIQADSVVLSPPPTPDRQLAEQLKDRVPELYVIGDAAGGYRIIDAIHEGFQVAAKI